MNIVRVKSIDMSYNSGVWDDDNTTGFGLVEIDTIGWLVEEREDSIILAMEHMPGEKQLRHLVAIPKAGIKEIKTLRNK